MASPIHHCGIVAASPPLSARNNISASSVAGVRFYAACLFASDRRSVLTADAWWCCAELYHYVIKRWKLTHL